MKCDPEKNLINDGIHKCKCNDALAWYPSDPTKDHTICKLDCKHKYNTDPFRKGCANNLCECCDPGYFYVNSLKKCGKAC